jgi:hypothetical protein
MKMDAKSQRHKLMIMGGEMPPLILLKNESVDLPFHVCSQIHVGTRIGLIDGKPMYGENRQQDFGGIFFHATMVEGSSKK